MRKKNTHPAAGARLFRALTSGLLLSATWSAADIPVGYKGTPFGGTPRAIPGRIDFEDYDLGGLNVAWKTDNKAGNAGSNAAGRADDGENQHPAFYSTNTNPGEVDKMPDNTLYPSDASPKSIYIGATHATDWANVTVNVAKAGTYWLSTHYGGENTTYKFSVRFNNVNKTGSISLAGTNNYHNWKFYRSFAKVELEAGVQVMQYMVESQHINWDYISFSADSNGVVGLGDAGRMQAGRNGMEGHGAYLISDNGGKSLRFTQAIPGWTSAEILDSRGRMVQRVFGGNLAAGSHSLPVPAPGAAQIRFLRLTRNGSTFALPLAPSAVTH